jgi:hypothetical protein
VVGIATWEKTHSLKSKLRERVEIPESELFVCLLNRPLFRKNVDQTFNFLTPFSLRFACCASPDAWAFSRGLLRSAPRPNFWSVGKAIMLPTWVHPYSRDIQSSVFAASVTVSTRTPRRQIALRLQRDSKNGCNAHDRD